MDPILAVGILILLSALLLLGHLLGHLVTISLSLLSIHLVLLLLRVGLLLILRLLRLTGSLALLLSLVLGLTLIVLCLVRRRRLRNAVVESADRSCRPLAILGFQGLSSPGLRNSHAGTGRTSSVAWLRDGWHPAVRQARLLLDRRVTPGQTRLTLDLRGIVRLHLWGVMLLHWVTRQRQWLLLVLILSLLSLLLDMLLDMLLLLMLSGCVLRSAQVDLGLSIAGRSLGWWLSNSRRRRVICWWRWFGFGIPGKLRNPHNRQFGLPSLSL